MKMIISFCNTFENPLSLRNLAVVDIDTGQINYICDRHIGITGIAMYEQFLFTIEQSMPIFVSVYNINNQESISRHELIGVSDPHSILIHNNMLYVVSTGSDEIVCTPLPLQASQQMLPIYKTGELKDTLHINSIALVSGSLCITMFGLRENERWSSARNGSIKNIQTGEILAHDLYHPHSLVYYENDWYVCESSMKCILKNGKPIILFKTGYVRGLVVNDKYIIVGISSGRKNSKSLGIVNNPADPGELIPMCKVFVYKKEQLEVPFKIFDFTNEFSEIYDIIFYN